MLEHLAWHAVHAAAPVDDKEAASNILQGRARRSPWHAPYAWRPPPQAADHADGDEEAPGAAPGTGGAAQQGSIPARLAPLAPLWAPLGTGSPHPMAPAHPEALVAPADPADDAVRLLSWNMRSGLVPSDRSLRDTLWRRRGPATCTDKEHIITGMLPKEGGFAIMLQETGIATRAQEMHVAAALRDKGYTPFFSSRLAETGATSTSRGGGLLTAVSRKYVAEHEVLSFTEIVPGKAAALEIRTDGGALTLINVHGPQAGCSPWAGRAAFWVDIQMYATARSLGGRHPVVIAGDTNVDMNAISNPATEHFRAGWEACGFQRATAGGEEDMIHTLDPSWHRVYTFLVNEPLLPWYLRESVWARGMTHPQVIGSDHLPVCLALPGLLNAAGRAAMPTPYSHTEGSLLPYDAEAAPVRHCLWAAVTDAQDEPSLAPWLGEQHAYGSMPAAALDKVFEHLHAAHDALARVVARRQPSPAGIDLAEGNPLESGERLQAAVLRYDTLAACAPAAYQADAARHGIRSEAALWVAEELRGASPGFRPTTQGQLQEELERQAAAPEEDIRQLRALLAAGRKRAIRDFWRRHAPDIAQRWKAVRGAIEVEAPCPSGLSNVRVPNTQRLLTEAYDVMFAVRAFWQELYDKRPVDPPCFKAVLGRHVPRVPDGAWTQVQQYSMQDLQSALDKADGKAPGPNHVEFRFIKALPAPVQWLLVHSYRAILLGAPPPMHWRDAHIWLSPKVPGSARLNDYRPIALGQLDMKLLTGPLTQRITDVLTRHGVVSYWQQGALPGSNTGPPLFMAQRQLQLGRPNYVFSFDARKGLRHRPARRPPPNPAPPLRAAGGHRPPAPPPHVRQAAHRHRTQANAARQHAARRPAGQPREPPAVRAPPGAPAQGAGAPPAPAGRGRVRPHPGLHRRPAGSGPHAAAFRRGRGGGGCVPGDDGHGAQPPQVRHGHNRGGPGPAAAPLSPPGKTHGTGYQRRTPSPTWESSCSRMEISPCSASTGCV